MPCAPHVGQNGSRSRGTASMIVSSLAPIRAPVIVRSRSIVRQITSATGQPEQVDSMEGLGSKNGRFQHPHLRPRPAYIPADAHDDEPTLRTPSPEEPYNRLRHPATTVAASSVRSGSCR